MKRFIIGLVVLFVLAVLAGGGYLMLREQKLRAFASAPFGTEAKTVEIPHGSGPQKTAKVLAQAGVVSSAELFYALIRRGNLGNKLKAGEYEFEAPLTPDQVLEKLQSGKVKEYRFTVPEGLRVEEILDILARSELKLDRTKLGALADNKAFLKKAGVPADRIEGYLYPDTYLFTRPFSEETVLTKMISRTREEYRKADGQRDPNVKLDELETMTLASIIEKETAAKEERPRISCVFHNRLKKKMALGTDPTVLYAMMLIRGHYVNNITSQDLRTPHPYNTYVVKGLPPGPIANPGAAAITAALHPLVCTDLYFVSRNNGTHEFCPDLDCHNKAVEKWQRQFFRDKRRKKKSP